MSGIMLVLDGMDDVEYDLLDGKTPYEFGKGSNFDRLESQAIKGEIRTIPYGFSSDTMVGMLSLFGVHPDKIPSGRSYLEAASAGIKFAADDLILRANFVKLDDHGNLENAFLLPTKQLLEQAKKCIMSVGLEMHYIGEYRSIIIAKGYKSYLDGLITHPPHQFIGESYDKILPHGNSFANILQNIMNDLYIRTKSYSIVPWGESIYQKLPKFPAKAALINKTAVVSGIAIEMGMENVNLCSSTGDIDTNLSDKAKIAMDKLIKNDIVVVHIGGTDEATHRKNPVEKAEFIGKIDRDIIGYFLDKLDNQGKLIVVSDHFAYCKNGGHGIDPVRFLLYKKGQKPEKHGLLRNVSAYELLLRE